MPKARTVGAAALVVLVVGVFALVIALYLDTHGRSHQMALASAVRSASDAVSGATVDVRAAGGGFTASAAELHLAVDPEATARAATAQRKGSAPSRFWAWTTSFGRQ